jgi:hypothetical protein
MNKTFWDITYFPFATNRIFGTSRRRLYIYANKQ